MDCLSKAMQSRPGAVVVALYGQTPKGLKDRLQAYTQAGLLVVAVNNNPAAAVGQPDSSTLVRLDNHNRGGLAGGLNRGVAEALKLGCRTVTLLDQDSDLLADGVLALQQAIYRCGDRVVGPAIWDLERESWHTQAGQPRMLITSGTSFSDETWQRVGPYRDWMEIDFIDHEWCSRARGCGLRLEVLASVRLDQQFGERHPNPLAHRLGLQQYSPYRRAVALRNLRWLVLQGHVPLDMRLKECVKMLLKPWCWLALEPARRQTVRSLRVGLSAPLGEPFPREWLGREAYYCQAIEQTFRRWPGDDRLGPLTWLADQAGVGLLGCGRPSPARGMGCWWMACDWPAPLLAGLAGADPSLSRRFSDPEAVLQGLEDRSADAPPTLLALTPALLAGLLAEQRQLPPGVAVLNLAWPAKAEQSAWLHLLAGGGMVLECRPAVRAYLHALGLQAEWCMPAAAAPHIAADRRPQLLLALAESSAETLLAQEAERLDPDRYSAYLRLDAHMLSLGDAAEAPDQWLNGLRQLHGRWVWLSGTPAPDDLRGWAVLAWAQQHGVTMTLLEESDGDEQTWLNTLMRAETTS